MSNEPVDFENIFRAQIPAPARLQDCTKTELILEGEANADTLEIILNTNPMVLGNNATEIKYVVPATSANDGIFKVMFVCSNGEDSFTMIKHCIVSEGTVYVENDAQLIGDQAA